MLYIIGGAPRSGKTILSKRILREKFISYFPTDALVATLGEAAPQLDVKFQHPLLVKPHKTWKVLKPLCYFFLHQEKEYLIEGDTLLPSQVKELIDEGRDVKCCFVGYTKLTSDQKLKIVREHQQGSHDWTNDQSDQQMLAYLDEMIEFGKHLKTECNACGIEFFDTSDDFQKAQDDAFNCLFMKKDTWN